MRYLGIDFGIKKIGLAFSEGEVAKPLYVLKIKSLKDAFLKIKKVILENSIDIVIVGIPESGQSKEKVEKFVKLLRKIIVPPQYHECKLVDEGGWSKPRPLAEGENKKIPWASAHGRFIKAETIDETLSTYQAKSLMIKEGLSKKARKEEDAYSASFILQSYLDSRR